MERRYKTKIQIMTILIFILVIALPLVFAAGIGKGKTMAGYKKADHLHEYYADRNIYSYCPYCGEQIRETNDDE